MAPRPVGTFGSPRNSDSWFKRVSENLRQILHSSGIQPKLASVAPVHFDFIDASTRTGKAQSFSIGVHIAIVAALAFALVSPPAHGPIHNSVLLGSGRDLLSYVPPLNTQSIGEQPSLGRNGGGGENDSRPARFGNLAPSSSMPIVPPRLTHDENVSLPAPPAVFDPNGPDAVATVTHLGLPWMKDDTDSAGPGKGHGFGSGKGGTLGDGEGRGAGAGESDMPYANVVSPVTCLYCPDPGYTEEARKAKLQGKILVRVLVNADGRAERIQILKGIGMGLDERAEETIRNWRFAPARDAANRTIPTWVMIETRFQLF